jgi:hypothetical protein
MSERVLHVQRPSRQAIVLNAEERILLNTIIDRLIPSDEEFPPPSSLHLLDEFIHNLLPSNASKTTLMLNEKRLHALFRDLNREAGGSFCHANVETQERLLKSLERREPAFYQELWTLANHSYYTRLATLARSAGVS